MEKKAYRECALKMASMYRQVITIMGDDTCGIMERFVEITAEKVKLLKAR
jgi:hypothetical protein